MRDLIPALFVGIILLELVLINQWVGLAALCALAMAPMFI
jgi:hypothetical protein